MIKPRIMPVIITAAITAVLLFGGWAIYNQAAVAAPLQNVVKDIEGVAGTTNPIMDDEQVWIDVELTTDADIKQIYNTIEQKGREVFGDRRLVLNIQDSPSEQLEELWSSTLFEIAEAMETKQYSTIPSTMDEASQAYKEVTVTAEIDETNVYITMKDNQSAKYVVLPRKSVRLEAWTYAS